MRHPSSLPSVSSHREGAISRRALLIGGGAAVLTGGTALLINKLLNGRSANQLSPAEQRAVQHLQNTEVDWVPMRQVIAEEEEDCIDGRSRRKAVCTPGGNIGDTALELTAVEQEGDVRFTDAQLRMILQRLLAQRQGNYYMHSDHHGLEHLAHDLHVDTAEAERLLRDPGKRRNEVMSAVRDPRNMGCGHLKLMAERPGNYPGARAQLVQGLVGAFYDLRWNGNNRMDLQILEGEHNEEGVFNINTRTDHVDGDTMVAKIQPKVGEGADATSFFPIHPQVEEFSEREWLRIMERITGVRNLDQQQVAGRMRRMRGDFLGASARVLARGKPTYNIVADPDRRTLEIAR